SDFFSSIDTLEKHLGQLRAWGHEIAVFQTLDPSEIRFKSDQPSLFEDMESETEMYIEPSSIRQEYEDRVATHNRAIAKMSSALGISHHIVPTDRPFERSLLEFLLDRQKLGKALRRSGRR